MSRSAAFLTILTFWLVQEEEAELLRLAEKQAPGSTSCLRISTSSTMPTALKVSKPLARLIVSANIGPLALAFASRILFLHARIAKTALIEI
jgi:hypothetical protein